MVYQEKEEVSFIIILPKMFDRQLEELKNRKSKCGILLL
jgi:hypothetical protein